MEFEFTAEVFEWRGPAPFYFVAVPDDACAAIADASRIVTYGWGMIPVTVTIGDTVWTTSLWPRDDAYVVPLKVAARRAEGVEDGMTITVGISIAM